ncbi:MAG: methylated-DNA--[protein]-cysteine S-methyltransferase [Chloroflexota bacterium]|nr:methylated-DNA--[protein]-cysteine S-methyltransferase [Chloroflexota bacterium]
MSSASTAYVSVPTPVGDILVAGTERGICALIIAAHAAIPSAFDALQHYCPAPLVVDADALVEATIQLTDYLNGARQVFDLPLDLVGTPFQRRVWDALLAIPYGETVSYRDLACALGQPGGAQAVGGAVARNPLSIIVPCHRVLGSNGSLTGYAWGVHVKRWLLDHECHIAGRTLF